MIKIPAHTEEWHKARLEVFTASRLYDLISNPKDKELPRPYVIEKAAEIHTGESQDSDYMNDHMLNGTENEELAINWFALQSGIQVEPESYFLKHDELLFGATADRYGINKRGERVTIEVKCPKSTTHLKRCLYKDVAMLKKKEPSIYWQIVGGALVGKSTKGVFIDFDHRVNPDCGLFVLMFDIPEEDFEIAKKAIEDGEKELKEVLNRLTPAA